MSSRTIGVTKNAWTQLTEADVESITFQNIGNIFVLIMGTNGVTAPGSPAGAFRYNPGQGERAAVLAEMFPGVAGANRVWAWCDSAGKVAVQHA